MHEFDKDPQAIQRRTVTAGEPVASREIAGYAPTRAPRSVHGEASLLHLQRTAGNQGVVQMLAEEGAIGAAEEERSPVHDVVGRGGGAPLDESTRSSMEASFGEDFSDVRVHTDARASQSAQAVGANAYTVGSDIVFRSGHFDSSSPTGQRTLAHELSHVVQQRSGPVDGTEAPGGIRLSDPDDRFERAADATADQVLAGPSSAPSPGSTTGSTSVQLEADETEEPMIQRAEAEGEQIDEEEMAGG